MNSNRRRKWNILRALLTLMAALAGSAATPLHAATPRYFPETQHTLADPMLTYWSGQGGLPVFGFPISEAFNERNADTGQVYLTQYFERNRFEAHPENQAPYQVLLGRLGAETLARQGRDWNTFPKADPGAAHYFAETGHAITHAPFWQYFSTRGLEFDGQRGISVAEAVALWGYPLSEPMIETNANGDTALTQWFERARFEDHGDRGVLLGLLGNEITADRRAEAPFQPIAQPRDPLYDYASRRLTELVNEQRRAKGMADLTYRSDIQAYADQFTREWTIIRFQGGDDKKVFDDAQVYLNNLRPWAGLLTAITNRPLEARCRGVPPEEPIRNAIDPSPALERYREYRTLTIGVYGPYDDPCGPSISVAYIVGQ